MRPARWALVVALGCYCPTAVSATASTERRFAGQVVVGALVVSARGFPTTFLTFAAESRPLNLVRWVVRTCIGDECDTRSETFVGAISRDDSRVTVSGSSRFHGALRLSASGVRPEPALASCRVGWASGEGGVTAYYEGNGYAARVVWTATVGGRRVSAPRSSGCGWYVAAGAVTMSST